MTIHAIHNHIIFRFLDAVNSKGEFEEAQHKSGIYLKGGYDKSAKSPRWATVLHAGSTCEHVRTGDKILIPALRWTEGVKYNEDRFWKTDESQIVGYQRDDQAFTPINKFVIFKQVSEKITARSSGLIVIEHTPDDTPSGVVYDIAADCVDDLKHGTVYYDATNFFNTFEYNDTELSFLKEDDVIVYIPKE
jgi:hypothetical protein